MMTTGQRLAVAAGALLLLAAVPARAQSEGYVRTGVSVVSGDKDSSKLQEFEVIPDKKMWLDFGLGWDLGQGMYLDARADRLWWDDAHAEVVFGRRAGFRVGLFYDRTPHWISNTARSYYAETSPGVFTLAPPLRTALAGATNFAGFAGLAVPVDLRTVRRTTGGFATLPLSTAFTLDASYQLENRSGHVPQAFGSGFAALAELAAPVDYQTENALFRAEYAHEELFVEARAAVSRFTNGVDRIVWDNATTATNTAATPLTEQASAYPDNRAFHVDLTAAYALPARHRVTLAGGMGRMRQDQALLPYTINPAIPQSDPAALPTRNADGRVDTTFLLARVTGAPVRFVGYSVQFRSYEMQDESGTWEFTPIVGDAGAPADAETNPHSGWKRETLRGEVHVNPLEGLQLGAAYQHDRLHHQDRYVERNTESTITGFADLRVASWAGLHGSYTHAKQKVDSCAFGTCVQVDEDPDADPPGASHYDIAERKTRRWQAVLSITPPVEGLSLGLSGGQERIDWEESLYGARRAKTRTWGGEVTYTFGDVLTLYGSFERERFDWDQASIYRLFAVPAPPDNPLNEWAAETRDDTKVWTVGGRWQAIKDTLDVSLDYTRSDGTSFLGCTPVLGADPAGEQYQGNCVFPQPPAGTFGTPQDWGDTKARFTWLKARAHYRVNKRAGAGVEFWLYRFEGVDWASDALDVYMGGVDPGAAKFVFLGVRAPDYDAKIYRAYLEYRF